MCTKLKGTFPDCNNQLVRFPPPVLSYLHSQALTGTWFVIAHEALKVAQVERGRRGPVDEKPEGLLAGLPAMQKQFSELVLLQRGETLVDNCQHQVHEKVEVHKQKYDKKKRSPL